MNRWIETAGRHAANCALGTAGCALGAWLANALRTACTWSLSSARGAELIAGRFGTEVTLPGSAPWILHALREFGSLALTVLGCGAASWVACRTKLAASLAAACVASWLAGSICVELLRYGWANGGALQLLLQSLGMPQGWEPAKQGLAVALLVGLALLLRRALRQSQLSPLSAFAGPACLVHHFLGATPIDSRLLERIGAAHAPAALAVVAALAAQFPWRSWQQPSLRSVAILSLAGALSVFIPVSLPAPDASVAWVAATSEHWSIRFEGAEFTAQERSHWLRGADERLPLYRERLGLRAGRELLSAHVVRSEAAMRSLGAGRSAGGSFALDARDGAVLMGTPALLPQDPRTEPLLAMRQAWGAPGSDAMALALARYAVGRYDGLGLQAAAARIACQEPPFTAAEALGIGTAWRSPLGRDTIGGAWVERVAARHGTAVLPTLYRQPAAASLQLCADCVPACAASSMPAKKPPRTGATYFKGVSFSHEGWGSEGYGGRAAHRELWRIRDLGANAVALVPYAFTAAPKEAAIRFRTLETDARLARAATRARQLGLAVLLKPHLWAGRRFHGDISFQDKSRFELWFADYRNWVLHYARFAQLHGIEVLAIGNELAGLTVHAEDWRSLIAQVRRVYSGHVTYAAHWEDEFRRLSFWDALDYIGVNFYFPIAGARARPELNAPAILAAERRIAQVQSRFEKPVLFTEVGFPALATAASRPWEENGSSLDAELQARCYAVWLEQFAQAPNVQGMFWWKWPSHGRGSPFDTSHQPLAKPALRVLGEWFKRL